MVTIMPIITRTMIDVMPKLAFCPDGRNHDDYMNKCEPYYIVLCSTCGSFGSHRKCGNIKGADVDKWLCVTCKNVLCKNVLERSLDRGGPSTSKASDPESSTPSSSRPSNLSSSVSNVSTSSRPSNGESSVSNVSTSSRPSNGESSVSNVSTSSRPSNGESSVSISQSDPGSSKNGTTKPSEVSRLETVTRQGTKKARSESPKLRSKVSVNRIRPESGLKVT